MIVVAWAYLTVFGLLGLTFLRKVYFGGLKNKTEVFVLLFSIIISSLSAGVIWGGLFQ